MLHLAKSVHNILKTHDRWRRRLASLYPAIVCSRLRAATFSPAAACQSTKGCERRIARSLRRLCTGSDDEQPLLLHRYSQSFAWRAGRWKTIGWEAAGSQYRA